MKPVDPVTQQLIRDCLWYDPETGKIYWTSSRGKALAGDEAGCLLRNRYRRVLINKHKFLAHRLAWFIYFGEWPTKDLDHVDGDRDNNRINNLREASRSANQQNLSGYSSSGFKGVYQTPAKAGRWKSSIFVNNEAMYLGTFGSAEEAARAYDNAAIEHFGAFAKLNFPRDVIA